MCCDKCRFYNWYYDWCRKWKCEVDGRAVYPCFKHRKSATDTNVGDKMWGDIMDIDDLIASYDPIDYKFIDIDKQESESFIPSEKELREIFCIDALKNVVTPQNGR